MTEKIFAPPSVTVTGENVIIENADGISSLCDSEIAVRLRGGMLIVLGDGLIISSLEEGRLVLSGKIRSVTFA